MPPLFVRLGLRIIRLLVQIKAWFVSALNLAGRLFGPLFNLVLKFIVLPIYRLGYALKRRLGKFYRPAKNRLMWWLTNRHAVHAVVIAIAAVAGIVNLGLSEVRAEYDSFGQRSILYSLVTSQPVEVIEEYADLDEVALYSEVETYGQGVLRAPLTGAGSNALADELSFDTDDLALTAPLVSAEPTAASRVPRTKAISYTVQSGDTLSTISQNFDISLNTLLWANSLTIRSLIKPGMELTILPVSGVQHVVKSGDTLTAIANKYNVSSDTILSYNHMADSAALSIGQNLIVPGGEVRAPAPVRSVAVRDIFTSAPEGSGGSTTPTAGAQMVWPTDLHYVVRGLSWFHTGMDIDCNGRANGTSTNDNYAAMDGVVQFAGAKSGYGYAVEINHGNGLVTRYGHFYSLYVQKGDYVTAGGPLGRCGSTGNSTGTHLHFEVIANGRYRNPTDYLGY
jgi:LysM repeat protein